VHYQLWSALAGGPPVALVRCRDAEERDFWVKEIKAILTQLGKPSQKRQSFAKIGTTSSAILLVPRLDAQINELNYLAGHREAFVERSLPIVAFLLDVPRN
jgi:hypothetical protein